MSSAGNVQHDLVPGGEKGNQRTRTGWVRRELGPSGPRGCVGELKNSPSLVSGLGDPCLRLGPSFSFGFR